jgi:hypothetical protein
LISEDELCARRVSYGIALFGLPRIRAKGVRQLKYFVALVDSGSLSKAAERLFVAQPSLSAQISNLEADLKTHLLIRSP